MYRYRHVSWCLHLCGVGFKFQIPKEKWQYFFCLQARGCMHGETMISEMVGSFLCLVANVPMLACIWVYARKTQISKRPFYAFVKTLLYALLKHFNIHCCNVLSRCFFIHCWLEHPYIYMVGAPFFALLEHFYMHGWSTFLCIVRTFWHTLLVHNSIQD
jgi:hypothetical protein